VNVITLIVLFIAGLSDWQGNESLYGEYRGHDIGATVYVELHPDSTGVYRSVPRCGMVPSMKYRVRWHLQADTLILIGDTMEIYGAYPRSFKPSHRVWKWRFSTARTTLMELDTVYPVRLSKQKQFDPNGGIEWETVYDKRGNYLGRKYFTGDGFYIEQYRLDKKQKTPVPGSDVITTSPQLRSTKNLIRTARSNAPRLYD